MLIVIPSPYICSRQSLASNCHTQTGQSKGCMCSHVRRLWACMPIPSLSSLTGNYAIWMSIEHVHFCIMRCRNSVCLIVGGTFQSSTETYNCGSQMNGTGAVTLSLSSHKAQLKVWGNWVTFHKKLGCAHSLQSCGDSSPSCLHPLSPFLVLYLLWAMWPWALGT